MPIDLSATFSQIEPFASQLREALRAERVAGDDEQAIMDFYRQLGLDKPLIVRLANPWQLWYAPALVTGFHRAHVDLPGVFEPISRRVREILVARIGEPAYNQIFNAIFDRLPEREMANFINAVASELTFLDQRSMDTSRDSILTELLERRMTSVSFPEQSSLAVDRNPFKPGSFISWYALSHYAVGVEQPSVEELFAPLFDPTGGLLNQDSLIDLERAIIWAARSRMSLFMLEFCCRHMGVDDDLELEERQLLDAGLRLLRSLHAFAPFRHVFFLSEPPLKAYWDETGRVHCSSGPAIVYRESLEIHAWHGTPVPAYAIKLRPDLGMIDSEANAEIKRVLIERYGIERYLESSDAIEIDRDERGRLHRLVNRAGEDIFLLQVVNSTAEPDGSFRQYFLRVPPTVSSVHEAVAWTFNLRPEEYDPSVES